MSAGAELVRALPADVRTALVAASRHLRGVSREDEWGFDEDFAEALSPMLRFLYERWWRVRATGVENVPAHGPALIASNHAGVVPWDAAMIATAILEEHPLPRHTRFLVLDWAFTLPWISVATRKAGGVPAAAGNAERLLAAGHLVGIFPEGSAAVGKSYRDRYRLERFGRGEFVQLALRAGAPIVPVAVVGSEEVHPRLGESRALSRLLGAPGVPITPTFPLLGPLGLVPLPSRWRIEFCEPVDVSSYGPDAAGDTRLVLELSDAIRDQIQAKIYENLVARQRAF